MIRPPSGGIHLSSEPDARFWYVNAQGTELVQLQRDRFVRNWRKTETDKVYPSYDELRPRFEDDWRTFVRFLDREGLGTPDVNQCEITYINHIELGVGWQSFGDPSPVLRVVAKPERREFLPDAEMFLVNASYAMPNERGRLRVAAQPAVRRFDGKEVLPLTLTARGKARLLGASRADTLVRRRPRLDRSRLRRYHHRSHAAERVGAPMMALASTAAMTLVYEIPDAAIEAAATGREFLSGDVRVQTKWEIDPVKGILGLEHLPTNWDGYGSGPISTKTANRAISLIGSIASLGFDRLPAPCVGPIEAGGILFQWTIGARQLNLSVFPEGYTEYLKCEAGEPFEEDRFDPKMAGRLRVLISWLLGAHA